MLVADFLVFTHPVSGNTIDLTAPLLKDFKQVLTALRKL